jgi:hypothetical protein
VANSREPCDCDVHVFFAGTHFGVRSTTQVCVPWCYRVTRVSVPATAVPGSVLIRLKEFPDGLTYTLKWNRLPALLNTIVPMQLALMV